MDQTKDIHKLLRPTKEIHLLCKKCRNYASDAEVVFDCSSEECPSTDIRYKLSVKGHYKTKKHTIC